MNTYLFEKSQDKKNINDISIFMNSNYIQMASDLIRELEKEWYTKLSFEKYLKNLAQNIFSLLNYEITVIQQLSEISFDTSIEPILLFNKNVISKKVERILYFNEYLGENKVNSSTLKNSFYKVSNEQSIKEYEKTAKNFYKKLNTDESKNYQILTSNKSRKIFNTNNGQRLTEEKESPRKHIISFKDENIKANNTFTKNKSVNLFQKNVRGVFENPVRKVKNIIINAKQKRNSGSLDKYRKHNSKNKNGINVKIFPGLKKNKINLSSNNIFYTESNESSKKSLKNSKNQDFEENGNFIIKVETVKDRETKQILQDGMKNIKQKLRLSEKENKVTTSIKYYIKNNSTKNRKLKK